MDGYIELALAEYDYRKGYNTEEIQRCIRCLREHLEYLWGVDDDSEDENGDEIPEDLFGEEGLDAEDIDFIIEECCSMMEVMLEKESSTISIDDSLKAIECYRGTDQQRTPEWYAKRRQMITASSSHKILKMDIPSGKGIGVIREKILPPLTETDSLNMSVSLLGDDDEIVGVISNAIPSNPDAPNIRGQRYEPVIRRMYERMNDVTVEEYDCVTHPKYPFLGASPDGIITSGKNRGRMAEIKCPNEASAVKDGLQVRDEYWSQMQLQMEVCNLEECEYIRCVVRDCDTISGIQAIIQEQVSKIRIQNSTCFEGKGECGDENKGEDTSVPLIVASGTLWMRTDGKYQEEGDGKFIHENSIHSRYGHSVVFIRHYVIFHKDVFIKTVYRDREWFQYRFLPKAIEAWGEIQRGIANPVAWSEKYPLKRRVKKVEPENVCVLFDD
jgi:hypothetical protein